MPLGQKNLTARHMRIQPTCPTVLVRLLLLALLSDVVHSVSSSASRGSALVGMVHKSAGYRYIDIEDSFSLLQRWASAPHALELSSSDLTTYIATGSLPAQALAQLKSSPADATGQNAAKKANQEAQLYEKQADGILSEMKDYEAKLDGVRSRVEAAHAKVVEQEKRLSDNFLPVQETLNSLIQAATNTSAKAEVQMMLERLTRMHYKQIGTLDRSATYWLEVAEKEKEARRVAEARQRLYSNTTSGDQKLHAMQNAREQDKAELDEWFKNFWAQLAASEEVALENDAPFDEDSHKKTKRFINDYASANGLSTDYQDVVPATSDVDHVRHMVPATPGAILPNLPSSLEP